MSIGERIKELRTVLNMSQQEFGERIGLKKIVVSYFEQGYHTTGINPSSVIITSICREFNANETWLLTGMGDMFKPIKPKSTESLDQLLLKYQISNADNMVIKKFLSLHQEIRKETVGARIRELRTVLDLSQQEFGKQIGINQVTVSCYETGKANPSTKAIASICREFHVSKTWLLTGIGNMPRPKPMESLNQLELKYQILDTDYAIIEKFLSLRPEIRKGMFDYLYEDVTTDDIEKAANE